MKNKINKKKRNIAPFLAGAVMAGTIAVGQVPVHKSNAEVVEVYEEDLQIDQGYLISDIFEMFLGEKIRPEHPSNLEKISVEEVENFNKKLSKMNLKIRAYDDDPTSFYLENYESGETILKESSRKEVVQLYPMSSGEKIKDLAETLGNDKRCLCDPKDCIDYASSIIKHSVRHQVDPIVPAGLMIQESNCNPYTRSKAGAEGLMQITRNTFYNECSGKLSKPVSFEEMNTKKYSEQNIECGIKIFNSKQREFGRGVKRSTPYQRSRSFAKLVDGCIGRYGNYGAYTGHKAALRGYNGWGCTKGANPQFVEQVSNIVYNLKSSKVKRRPYRK